MSDLGTVYRVYWLENGRNCEAEYPTLTEATVRKAELKRAGIAARIVAIKTTVGG